MTEIIQLSQQIIDLADGDLTRSDLLFGSPLAYAIAMLPIAKACLGIPGWKSDLVRAIETAHEVDSLSRTSVVFYTYISAYAFGMLRPDVTAVRVTTETMHVASQAGDNIALNLAETVQGVTLICQEGGNREVALDLLAKVRARALDGRFTLSIVPIANSYLAREQARVGDVEGAISLARATVNDLATSDRCIFNALATSALVEVLLQRGEQRDVDDAHAAVDWLAAVPIDEGFVINEITLLRLRALIARAKGEDADYRDFRDRYRKMAAELGFEGHMAWAEAMP